MYEEKLIYILNYTLLKNLLELEKYSNLCLGTERVDPFANKINVYFLGAS